MYSEKHNEELGIIIHLRDCFGKEMRPRFTINYAEGFDDFYVITDNLNIKGLESRIDEVQAVAWADINTITRMMQEGMFIPYKNEFIHYINELTHDYGCIERRKIL